MVGIEYTRWLIMPRAEAYGSSFVCLSVCHSVCDISFAAHVER